MASQQSASIGSGQAGGREGVATMIAKSMSGGGRKRAATGLAVLLLTAASVGTAAATTAVVPVVAHCGQTLTRSTLLASDVGPCGGDGLVVGADGITVNLNGHRVLGTSGPGDNVGIRIQRRTGVVVSGGTVKGFGAGVAIMGGARNTVTGITATDNVGLIDGSGDFGDGLAIFDSPGNVLRANTVRHNGPFEGIGVFGRASTGNQIVRNLVELNNIARFAPQNGLMLSLDDGINLGSGLEGGRRGEQQESVVIAAQSYCVIAAHAHLPFLADLRVEPARLGQPAGLVGAAALLVEPDRYWHGT